MDTTATYTVAGMTCGHCVSAVSEEIGLLDGVTGVEIDLNAGGNSSVTVSSAARLAPESVRAAVEEAGYSVIGTSG